MEKRLILTRMLIILLLMLCVGIAGCGEDDAGGGENLVEDNFIGDSEQNALLESDLSEVSEEDNQEAKNLYVEILQAGEHICPKFPEVQGLAYVDEQFLLDSICPAIVRLESGDLFGSGVIWQMDEDYIWIITNQHVLVETVDTDLVEVVFWDGIRTHGEILGVSEEYDLGFVKVNLQEMGYYTIDRYYQVRYDVDTFKELLPGDDLFILGSADYPAGNLYYGTIGNKSIYMDIFETEMLWAYCEVKAGMSGGGVFDRFGNLIGIVCAGNDEKEAAVLPIERILSEWQDG